MARKPRGLEDALRRVGIAAGDHDLTVDDVEQRLERGCRRGIVPLTGSPQRLFSVRRSSFSGDETEQFSTIRPNRREALMIYTCPPNAVVGVVRPGTNAAIATWIEREIDRQGWSLGQFYGTVILNESPSILPKALRWSTIASATEVKGVEALIEGLERCASVLGEDLDWHQVSTRVATLEPTIGQQIAVLRAGAAPARVVYSGSDGGVGVTCVPADMCQELAYAWVPFGSPRPGRISRSRVSPRL